MKWPSLLRNIIRKSTSTQLRAIDEETLQVFEVFLNLKYHVINWGGIKAIDLLTEEASCFHPKARCVNRSVGRCNDCKA